MKLCLLEIYGDVQAVLIADEELSDAAWQAIIDSAAERYDDVHDRGAACENRSELKVIYDGDLSALICYRHSNIKNVGEYAQIRPSVGGW